MTKGPRQSDAAMVPLSAQAAGPHDPPELRFERWYERHFDYVWRSLRRLGVPVADLGDLTHDVFIVAWRRRTSLDPDRPARPWLFGVAFRTAAAHRRRAWFRLTRFADTEPVAELPSPEQNALERSRLHQLQKALDRVPLPQRAVLLLHDFEEVPMHDVARALDVPLKTAYSRLAAARKRFRQAFRQAELNDLSSASDQTIVGESR